MDERRREFIDELRDKLLDASNGRMGEIIKEATDEAFAEAKAIIKGAMLEAIFQRTLSELESMKSNVSPGEERATPSLTTQDPPADKEVSTFSVEASAPTSQSQAGTAESRERTLQEIEGIRRRIADNERLLGQAKSPATDSERPREPLLQVEAPTPADRGAQGNGYYLYGIMKRDGNQVTEGLPTEGIDPALPVYALPYRTIQAIVSEVSLQEFGQEELRANLSDMHWVDAKARSHLGVLESVLAKDTVVPIRFCTIYQSQSGVLDMLEQHYDDLLDTLARLGGKQEWGVKAYCEVEALRQRVGETSDSAKELKATMDQKPQGAAYFWKKKLEETIAAETEQISDECAQLSHDRLSSHAAEAVINPLQDKKIVDRTEEMILNAAYLVADEQMAGFRAELKHLEKAHADLGLSYEITGPWPPYSFVTSSPREDLADESVGS